ncbi:hypothetical protein NDU88_007952 [Pleurodeles waltl]|uniref:Prolactin receptor n=1 Tax=Pleurodeles waltl TaxID=8319 RepID=A0AAV7NXG8_PLEWA|nr:hypothetical protein NDU88_007952 [Pleurodeles waltl]
MKCARRHQNTIEADPQKAKESEEPKVCTPGEHKQAQGGSQSAMGQGIEKYFTPLEKNVCCKSPPPGGTLSRQQPNWRSLSDSAITLGTSCEVAPPSTMAQESMPYLSIPCASSTQPLHITHDNSLEHTIQPQKWEPPLAPIIVIKDRGEGGKPKNNDPKRNSTEGSQEKPGLVSPALAKYSTSPRWEVSLTQEELEEVFNKEEEQGEEGQGEDALLSHIEKSVKHPSTIGKQAL